MAKPNEEKSDGLEITSIGALYKGSWDKKYWSSSRGKDRYPYPIGYQAVRTHNGITYKMQIHEGLKGPLFVITSTDGQSCSGQTPDITWESFQKKGYPRIKMWHGKRFLCKIDGVEFFGFRNTFVQRLLRELVTNVSGTAEQTLVSSSFCNGASGTEHHNRCPDSCTYPDLLPYLARPQITGKRSRKHKVINVKSISGASVKRLRPQDLTYNAEDSNSRQGNQRNHNDLSFMTCSASNEEFDICNLPRALPVSVNFETAQRENSSFSAEDGLPLKYFHFPDHLKLEPLLPQEESKLVNSKNCISRTVANNLSKEEQPLDRSQDTEIHGSSSSMATEDKCREARVPKDSQGINDVDLCAPDTLDLLQDNTSDSAPTSHKEIHNNVKDELISAHMAISEGPVIESHPEEEMGTSDSNASSEKSDFDSVGQEIAKSMMTVLLPQALPLLMKASRKKKATVDPSEISFCEENNGTGHFVDVASPAGMLVQNSHAERQEKMHIISADLGSVVPSSDHIESVVPDSFENDQFGYHVTDQVPLFSDISGAAFVQDTCTPDTSGLLVSVHEQKSSVCQLETRGSKQIFCYDEVQVALNGRPQKGDILISESALGCTSPSKKNFVGRSKDVCNNLDESSTCPEIHSKEKDLNSASDCNADTTDANLTSMESSVQISREKIGFKTDGAGPGNMCFSQVPNVATSKRKYNGPLSESIICRKFGDNCVPETYPARGTLLASEIFQVSSSDDCPNKEVLFGTEARLEGQPHSLHIEKTTLNSEDTFSNMASIISQNQAFVRASKNKDTSNFLDPSVSCIENSQAVEKELVGHQNIVEFNSVSRLEKQWTSFCDNNMSDAKGVQVGSDLKTHVNMELNNELEGIVELVGCYIHPTPVLLVLLNKKGNEIYICVLCGFLVDKVGTLFIYKVPIKEPRVGRPSFIGHASITLPISKDTFGREIAPERYGLQFTPDGQCLVLLNSIKAPYCSERKIHCLCSACTSDCFEKNAVKIVRVELGYVSVVAKLKTVDSVHCILVCEPNYLVAVEESGRLHLWIMNSTWSGQIEEFVLPTYDCISPCIVDLKRIPKCAAMVIGHNGFGEFSLWDISKRILISRFSAPSTSVCQFIPISLFSWQRKGPGPTNPDVEEHINGIMAATRMRFSEHSENYAFLPLEGEHMAIWLLVSTASDSDAQHDYQSTDCQINPVGWWRLALLVKNMVILGSALDPRAAAIGASAGHGIIGTRDGLVYMWELSTGTKLGTLHYFKGSSVSCIASDDSQSGVLAVVSDGGQLLVYLHSQGAFAN